MIATSLVFLALGAAYAQQRPAYRPGMGPSVEGRYQSVQRDGTLLRTLRLERDGAAEIVTEYRKRGLDRDPRGGVRLSDREVERYGRSADEAARGRSVCRTGRWSLRGDRLTILLDDGSYRNRGRELPFVCRGGDLVLDRSTEAFGSERIVFCSDRPAPRASSYGNLLLDTRSCEIEGYDFFAGRDKGCLTVWTENRKLELRGRWVRRDDEITLFAEGDRMRDSGIFKINLKGRDVVSVFGTGTLDGRPLTFPLSNPRDGQDSRGDWPRP